MTVFTCHVCRTPLSAEDHQAGQLVRCPTCGTTLRVPQRKSVAAGVGVASFSNAPLGQVGGLNGGKRYGFNCGYCSSRLEATAAMAAQEGQCPTCGNNITIPILDRYGRLIDPRTREIIKQDPHPVHAYAAAGDRAPKIIRTNDGGQSIQCSRCSALSSVSANNCRACGMPFTMEGTTLEASGSSNGFCVASLVLGIISIPAFCAVIPGILAIVFGVIGFSQASRETAEGGGKGMAVAGIICGAIGCLLAVAMIAS
jgi:DNA-directed RNA polymerase subunit RPC12/RpoP